MYFFQIAFQNSGRILKTAGMPGPLNQARGLLSGGETRPAISTAAVMKASVRSPMSSSVGFSAPPGGPWRGNG